MKRNWLIRTTWFWLLASVPSLAVYLWNPQATGYFFLVFAFCGYRSGRTTGGAFAARGGLHVVVDLPNGFCSGRDDGGRGNHH